MELSPMEPEKPVQYPAGYNASEWTCCDFAEHLATHVTHALCHSQRPSRSAGQQPGFRPRISIRMVPNTSRLRKCRYYALSVNIRREIDKETLWVGKRVIFRGLDGETITTTKPDSAVTHSCCYNRQRRWALPARVNVIYDD